MVYMVGRHSCVARATAICILHMVESFRSYSTIDYCTRLAFRATKNSSVEIAHKIYDRYTFDKSTEKIDGRVLVPRPHVKACDFLSFV